MIIDDRPAGFLLTERHYLELERAAVRALGHGDSRSAWRFADRRCRIPPLPNSQVYLLRAEALFRLGHREAALRDVARAIEIDPDDVAATRRLLCWGDEDQQAEAAAAILSHDNDRTSLRAAFAVLREQGRETFARVDILDGEITGWVAWLPGTCVEIELTSDTETYGSTLPPDPHHALADNGSHAATFRIPRPASAAHQFLHIHQSESVIATAALPGRGSRSPAPSRKDAAPGNAPTAPSLTVIVPVYADYKATKACLDSLLAAAARTPDTRVMIVDDASPDPQVRRYLATLAGQRDVTVLTNDRNLGFVGAINRGLQAATDGDIILLNADTLVPAGALGRLRDVVTATPGVGTATPLSNNGEFTSFPVKNKSNPLPPLAEVEALDRLAATANAGVVQDIPNGIGFCLYLTRACLDAVGELSDDFHRGYMEDVDLCLRATEAGFRNVCVASVFVGHEGSRSFRQEKRSLVVRNLKVLAHRYPRYSVECAAFLLADPLRDSRGRLEQALLATGDTVDSILLCGAGAMFEVAMARAGKLTDSGSPTLVVSLSPDGARMWASLHHPQTLPPQSLRFDLALAADAESFWHCLAALAPDVFELVDPSQLPAQIFDRIRTQRLPYDILVANTAWAEPSDEGWQLRPCRQSLVDGARQLIGADDEAEDFLREIGLGGRRAPKAARRRPAKSHPAGAHLGIIALCTSADEFRAIRDLGLQLLAIRPDLDVVILGGTLDDLKLMQLPNTHVTGPITASEIPTLVQAYGIDRFALGLGGTVFGHPIGMAAAASGLPSVRFGSASTAGPDLWIAPGTPTGNVAEMIDAWLGPPASLATSGAA
ncbi:glycosyltransferase [Tardiphaga sp. vice154]|uniref:glycosyltransferase n=1 Tax=Tardiphaga sp. vice154 TaxID=2592814 RepID=UPI001AED7CCB|nr:glycosyltransferase [Tardiphaga sp. vice154]